VHHLQTGRVQEHFLRQMHGTEHAGRTVRDVTPRA
jgi:hypothetical protein